MPRFPLHAVPVALQTLRTNIFHTALSTLGIVIGVAALVAILALGDGMEQYARAQILETTDLQALSVTPRTSRVVDDVRVPVADPPRLTLDDLRTLRAALADQAEPTLTQSRSLLIGLVGGGAADTARYGAVVQAVLPNLLALREAEALVGRLFDDADLDTTTLDARGAPPALVNGALAARLTEAPPATLLGRRLALGGDTVEVAGVVPDARPDAPLTVAVPFGTTPAAFAGASPPVLTVQADRIEDVPAVQARLETWLDTHTAAGASGFQIVSNATRVEQARRGMLAFKLVMGLITGIAVVVGGVGVMNVLLVSITERTREIGVRKATGARRSDVLAQFLAESVAISFAGCLAGLALGLATVAVAAPLVREAAGVPFHAALTGTTVLVVLAVALVIGLVFGTYPAWRAARLAPIDALRHE